MTDPTPTDRQDDFWPRLGLMGVVIAVCAGLVSLYVLSRPSSGGPSANTRAASAASVPTDRPSGLRGNNIMGMPSAPTAGSQIAPPPGRPSAQQPQPAPPAAQAPAAKANIPPPPVAKIPQVSNPDPEQASRLASEGNQASQRQDYPKAIELFSQAIALNPAPIFFGLRGDVNWRAGKLDDAIADYDNAIALDPTGADGYFGRARVYRDKGDRASATRDLQIFLELKPNDAANTGIRQEAQEMINSMR